MSEAKAKAPPVGLVVRRVRPADREAIESLGHPPPIPKLLCPTRWQRLAWRLLGTRAFTAVAEDMRTGSLLGTAQFVRSKRNPDTWMFGHWRVAAQRRRTGIGRRLLEEGRRLASGVGRLYSYVEWGNEISMAAHERLGFEAGETLLGRAPLGTLSTIGPATPSLKLGPVGRADWPRLFALYARAMGSLWMRLFPGLGPHNFGTEKPRGMRAGALAVARQAPAGAMRPLAGGAAETEGDAPWAGLVFWEGSSVTFFAEPGVCDAGLLARVALQILAQGTPREQEIELRGLPRSLGERPGPIALQALMAIPDVKGTWGD